MERHSGPITAFALVTASLVLLAGEPALQAQSPAATPPQGGEQQAPAFRGGTDAVLVDVYPHRDGRIVENLTAADFDVLEDGRPQHIDSFEFVQLAPAAGSVRLDPNSVTDMRRQAADPHNRVFVVYLDTSHSTASGGQRIRQPLVNMLDRTVGAQDLFGVMLPDMRPIDLALGRVTTSIDEQLSRHWTWGTRQRITTDSRDPMEERLRGCFHDRHTSTEILPWLVKDGVLMRYLDDIVIDRRREERVFNSLESLVDYLGAVRQARSVVVAVTDGWPLLPRNDALSAEATRDARFNDALPRLGQLSAPRPGSSDQDFAECVRELGRLADHDGERRLREIIGLANRNNVSFYPVASAGLEAFDSDLSTPTRLAPGSQPTDLGLADAAGLRNRGQSLRTLAEATDGLAVVDTDDLSTGLRRVADDVSAYYLLTYASDRPRPDGRFRKIEVRVKGAGIDVRARRGYTAAREDDASRALPVPTAPVVPAGVAAALTPLQSLRPGAEVFVHGVASGANVRVAVELPAGSRTVWPAGTTVSAVLANSAGLSVGQSTAPLDVAWRNASLTMPLPSDPGPWRLTVTVGDGRDRLQEQLVVAPAETGALGLPWMGRGRPALRSPVRAVATFQFQRTERVHVEWPVITAIDSEEARLLDAKGQPLGVPVTVGRLPQSPLDGTGDAMVGPSIAVDVLLNALAPGDYVIEVTTKAGTTTTAHYAAFRVVP